MADSTPCAAACGGVALPARPSLTRVIVVTGAFVAVLVSIVITASSQQRQPIPSVLAQLVLPAMIAALVFAGRRDRVAPLTAALALLEVEALLAGWLFDVGIGFALLFPLIGIGLVHPLLDRRGLVVAYGSAGLAAVVGVALALTVGGSASVLGHNTPVLTIAEFAALISMALALLWRAGERRRLAALAERAVLQAHLDAQERVARAHAAMRLIFEQSPVATFAVNADGVVESWNPTCATMFGWDAARIVGERLPETLRGTLDGAPSLEPTTSEANARRDAGRLVTITRRDGRPITLEVHTADGSLLADGSFGRIVQVVDVTEREEAEIHRRRAIRMEAVGRLAGGVAHDFNNMLSAITGYASLALTAMPRGGPGVAEVHGVLEASERAAALVRQLLLFARPRAPEVRLVAPGSTIVAIAPMLRLLLGNVVVLRTIDRSGGALVRIDPVLLDQVVVNLAVNARDAMSSGGRLDITCERLEAARGTSWVRITMTDTGCGIEPAVMARVFEPFFTTKGDGAGTGLGLSNVLDIVHGAGGGVDLHSEVGRGTTVVVDLPQELSATA